MMNSLLFILYSKQLRCDRWTQIMLEQMEELRKKERHLGELNKQLRNKLEAEGATFRAIQGGSWECTAVVAGNTYSAAHSQSNVIDCEPTLQIGYHPFVPPEAAIPQNAAGENNLLQGWLL